MQQIALSPFRQNPVTDMVAVRQNPAIENCCILTNGDQGSYSILTNRLPQRVAAFIRDHIDLLHSFILSKFAICNQN